MQADDHPDTTLDPGALDDIEEKECWELLANHNLGRVAVVVEGDYPHVVPVNYVLVGRTILFRSDAGTKLAAVHRSRVAFEVDEFDLAHEAGWSVVVRGAAQEIDPGTNPRWEQAAADTGLKPWAPGERRYLVRVVADRITGRRIRPAETPPASDPRGYV